MHKAHHVAPPPHHSAKHMSRNQTEVAKPDRRRLVSGIDVNMNHLARRSLEELRSSGSMQSEDSTLVSERINEKCCCRTNSSAIMDIRDKLDVLLRMMVQHSLLPLPPPAMPTMNPPSSPTLSTAVTRGLCISKLSKDCTLYFTSPSLLNIKRQQDLEDVGRGQNLSPHPRSPLHFDRSQRGCRTAQNDDDAAPTPKPSAREDQSLKSGVSQTFGEPCALKRGTSSIGIQQLFGGASPSTKRPKAITPSSFNDTIGDKKPSPKSHRPVITRSDTYEGLPHSPASSDSRSVCSLSISSIKSATRIKSIRDIRINGISPPQKGL